MDSLPNKVLWDSTAEEAVIGSMLFNRDVIITVAPMLKPSDFHDERLATIYEAILSLYQRRIPSDISTVAGELQRVGKLDAIGNYAGLVEHLTATVYIPVHIAYYAAAVERYSVQRQLIAAGGRIAGIGFEGDTLEPEELLGKAQRVVLDIAEGRNKGGYHNMSEMAGELLDRLDVVDGPQGVKSGYGQIDWITGGFQKSDLIVLAARPGVGKTALSLNIAMAAAKDDMRVGMFELEMSYSQMYERMTAIEAGVDGMKLRIGRGLTADESMRVARATGALSGLPIFVDDAVPLDITTLRARANRMQAEEGLDLLIVDYLQLVASSSRKRNGSREQEVAEVSRGLKLVARELNVPVVACAQLNRQVEQRAEQRPQLSDLRESGGIEADADIVMFLHHEGGALREPGWIELLIDKHRSGALGAVTLHFDPPTMRFTEVERRYS